MSAIIAVFVISSPLLSNAESIKFNCNVESDYNQGFEIIRSTVKVIISVS